MRCKNHELDGKFSVQLHELYGIPLFHKLKPSSGNPKSKQQTQRHKSRALHISQVFASTSHPALQQMHTCPTQINTLQMFLAFLHIWDCIPDRSHHSLNWSHRNLALLWSMNELLSLCGGFIWKKCNVCVPHPAQSVVKMHTDTGGASEPFLLVFSSLCSLLSLKSDPRHRISWSTTSKPYSRSVPGIT